MRNFLISSFLLFVASCGVLPPLDPVASEVRIVQTASDPAKTVTIFEGMVWYNVARTRGIRFPEGTYLLEAQDEDYWYFRSSAPLEFRTFNGGNVSEARAMAGGIMIGKAALSITPAGGYVDGEGSTRIMVWKLGREFLNREGRNWKKSF